MKRISKTLAFVLLALFVLAQLGPGGIVGPPGPRLLLVVYESSQMTPATAQVLTGLRDGAPAAYLKEKGHTLQILDKDAKGPDGQPVPAVTRWQPYSSLPELLIVAPPEKLLHRAPLPGNADGVLQLLKQHGG